VFRTNVIEKIKTDISCSITFFLIVPFMRMQKKYCRARQAIDGYIAHASIMLDTYSYKLALQMYNTYCFSTATTVD
jgi:hypothetical protein